VTFTCGVVDAATVPGDTNFGFETETCVGYARQNGFEAAFVVGQIDMHHRMIICQNGLLLP
jgi:hypothetical protein